MERISLATVFAFIIAVVAGCSSVVRQESVTCRGPWAGGPVTEVSAAVSPPPGMVDAVVKATIKTHPKGFYLIEPKDHMHGRAGYPFVLTVDEKTFEWRDDGHLETLPSCDEEGKSLPEGGKGMRYSVEKKLILTPGLHRVTLELPSEKQSITVALNFSADSRPYLLEFKPVYNGPETRRFGFLYGIVDINAFLNGMPIGKCREHQTSTRSRAGSLPGFTS